jgi:hypothetical protein
MGMKGFWAGGLLWAAGLAGCVNLGAVTDYSASAGAVLADAAPAARWRDSEKRLMAHRLEGDRCEIGRSGRRPQADFDAAFDEAAAVHAALGQYFKALGELASDKLPLPSQALAPRLDAMKKAGIPVEDADVQALQSIAALLSRALDGYRHTRIKALMQGSHADVARLIGLLRRLAQAYDQEVQGERIQAVNFLQCSIAVNDVTDKFWGRREMKRLAGAYDAEHAALQQYAAALDQIRRDHDAIRAALELDGKRLAQTLKAIADTRKELDAAHRALARL